MDNSHQPQDGEPEGDRQRLEAQGDATAAATAPLGVQSADPSPVAAQVKKHLKIAAVMNLLGFLFVSIVFIPIAIYHGIQANVKGGQGQGNSSIIKSIIFGIASLLLYYIVIAQHYG